MQEATLSEGELRATQKINSNSEEAAWCSAASTFAGRGLTMAQTWTADVVGETTSSLQGSFLLPRYGKQIPVDHPVHS
jgi:hypothetical protein